MATVAKLANAFDAQRFAMRHYTVNEVAELWHLSDDAVRKIFENEPGVLALGDSRSGRTRRYVTLRIPEDVVARVHRLERRESRSAEEARAFAELLQVHAGERLACGKPGEETGPAEI
jgi:hypothetical protein